MSDTLSIPQSAEAAVSAALAELTETQRRRILARAQGATLQQIADTEGCSTSAVDQSLKAPAVRTAMTILGHSLTIAEKRGNDVKIVDPILKMIEQIMEIAFNATRAVVVSEGGGVTRVVEVADYPTRLTASCKFLSLIDRTREGATAGPLPDAAAASRTVELEQTETTSRRRRVRVS